MAARRIGRDFLPLVVILAAIIAGDYAMLIARLPVYLDNQDNLYSYYSMWYYFIEGLRHGAIDFYQPFLWAGTRIFGDPDFKINLVQIVTGVLWGPDAAYRASNYMLIVERVAGTVGLYALLGAVCPGLNRWPRAALALAYAFSFAAGFTQAFHNLSVPLATAPWVLFIFARSSALSFPVAFGGLAVLFYVTFSYSQLQMGIYAGWLILSFVLCWVPPAEKRRALLLLIAAGAAGVALSAYFILPLVDNLYFADPGSGRVRSSLAEVGGRYVPPVYLLRLFVPMLFGPLRPDWWPVWRDGWTSLETFNAFQGVAITLLAGVGLFFRRVPLYLRVLYLFLIVTVSTGPGLKLLYVMNLGTGVNYGRQTMFLALVAPIIAAFALLTIAENRRAALAFAIFSGLCCAAFAALCAFGLPEGFVTWVYARAFKEFRDASASTADALAFYGRHAGDLQRSFALPAICAGVCALVGALWAVLPTAGELRRRAAPALSAAVLLVALGDGTAAYLAVHYVPPAEEMTEQPTYTLHYPGEDAMIADGLQVTKGPVDHRLHIDIYFGEQWSSSDRTRRLSGAEPRENRFRLMPNFLAGNRIPVTSGYSSVIPSAKRFTEMIHSVPGGLQIKERAIGVRATLRPSMLEAFAVKWVLRHQPAMTASIEGGAPDRPDDPWERRFEASSRLIYQDDAYRLYEYRDARPAIDIPDRIAFGADPVRTFAALEKPDQPWTPTAALPAEALAKLSDGLRDRVATEDGVRVIRQSGRIVETSGEAGRWTRIAAEADTPAILLLGVKYDRWWRASVNGRPAPLIRANDVFAAVEVPAGRSDIAVELRPWSAWIGLGISGVAALGLLIGMSAALWRRLHRTAADRGEGRLPVAG